MRIYLAVPYTNIVKPNDDSQDDDSQYGWVSNKYVQWLRGIIQELESLGHKVFCSHRDVHQWGKSFPDLKYVCQETYNKLIEETDVLIAYLGQPQSGGVAIEIGWAISNKIPVIIAKKPKEKITLIADGLQAISPCEIIEFENEKQMIQKLQEKMKLLKNSHIRNHS